MSLEDRLRSTIDEHVGRATADDEAWDRLQRRLRHGPPAPPAARRSTKVATAVFAFAVFVGGAVFVWQAFRPGPASTPSARDQVAGVALWPEGTAADLAKVQAQADAGDPGAAWRLDPKLVAERFAEDVLGWRSSGSSTYTIALDPVLGPPGGMTATVSRTALPCPTPAPGAEATCPPPYSTEKLGLRQLGTHGTNGVWSVTTVHADNMSLRLSDVRPQPVVRSIYVSVTPPPTADQTYFAESGATVGGGGPCGYTVTHTLGRRPSAVTAIGGPASPPCETTGPWPAYAWVAAAQKDELQSSIAFDPFSRQARLLRVSFYGVSAVPFTLSVGAASAALPADPCRLVTATQVADATGGQVTSSRQLTPSDMKSQSPGMPLPCEFETNSRFGTVVVTVDPTNLTGFTTERDRNTTNTMSIPDLGDEAFISGGASIWVRVGDGYFSIGAQHGAGVGASAMLEVLAKDALHDVGYASSPSIPSPPPTVSATPTTAGIDYGPSSVGFWDAHHGVVVGTASCRRCESSPGGFIATTSDGGQTWHITNDSYPPLGTVSVVPGGVAYADAGARILRTTDYGDTWHQVNVAPAVSPSFSSASDGWAAWVKNEGTGDTGPLLHTSDGGRIYTKVASPCPSLAPQIRGLSFATPTEGWVLCTGDAGVGNQWKDVYRTSDGGASWTKVYGSGLTYGYAQQVSFLADGHGWLLFSIRGQPEYTTDGGAHWTASDVAQPEVSQLVSVSFLNDEEGYGVRWANGGAELLHTTDGGRNWTFVSDFKPDPSLVIPGP